MVANRFNMQQAGDVDGATRFQESGQQGQTAVSVTGFLTVPQTAVELETSDLAVKRLVAKSRIQATTLGKGGAMRVAASEVARYIGAGCPDLDIPGVTPGEVAPDWFATADTQYPASRFTTAVLKAAKEQVPAVSPVLPPERDQLQPEVTLKITDAVRAAARAPAPRFVGQPDAPMFADQATAFLVDRIRDFASRAVAPGQGTRLERLYESPDAYDRVVSKATDRLKADSITFAETLPTPDGRAYVTVRFVLPLTELVSPRLAQVALAAF